jgi:hypothetical protein
VADEGAGGATDEGAGGDGDGKLKGPEALAVAALDVGGALGADRMGAFQWTGACHVLAAVAWWLLPDIYTANQLPWLPEFVLSADTYLSGLCAALDDVFSVFSGRLDVRSGKLESSVACLSTGPSLPSLSEAKLV